MNARPLPSLDDLESWLEIGRRLLEHEAILLEERRWNEWLELYAKDCVYWVPAWSEEGILNSDPETQLSLVYYAARAGLEDRIIRIRSTTAPASQPLPRTTHLISNVRLREGRVGNVTKLKASWITHVFAPDTNRSHAFFGEVEHDLRLEEGQPRIFRKKIVLHNDYIPTLLDLYCL